jgi:glycosyltransferase involved in cell wall biosynthesis
MFAVVKKIAARGIDCKLLCLGDGPLLTSLGSMVKEMGLEDRIYLLGRKSNIFDYIAASDVFLHLSSTEASNSAVKEVGLLKRAVIVCNGVGDFDDYINHGINGFIVDRDNPTEQAAGILFDLAENPSKREKIGETFYNTVINTFDIKNVVDKYHALLKS